MKVTHELTDGVAVVGVRGDLTFDEADSLVGTVSTLIERGAGDVILDMSQLAFIDSRGLSALLEMNRRIETLSGRMIVAGLSPTLRRVVHVTRLESALEQAGDVEEARGLIRRSVPDSPGGRHR